MTELLQQLVNGLTLGSLYALIAVGYTVVYGIIQLINFAHGEVFMIGAFGALATWTLLFEGTTALWVLPIMLLGAIIVSVTTAVLMERFAYRPLRDAPRLAPLITAIGISVALQEAIRLFYPGAKSKIPFPQIDVVTGPALTFGGVTVQRAAVFTVGALLMSAAFLWYFVNRTRSGHGMQAVSEDPDTARLMGVNVDRIIVIAFAIGALLAAIAGVAQGLHNATSTSGWASSPASRPSPPPCSVASATSWAPSSAASSSVSSRPWPTQFIPGQFGGSAWKDVWAFVLLIVVLVFRPQGILGARVVDRA